MGFDNRGIWIYEETDAPGTFSDLLNLGQESTSDAVALLLNQLVSLQSRTTNGNVVPTRITLLAADITGLVLGNGTAYMDYTVQDKIVRFNGYILFGSTTTLSTTLNISMASLPLAESRYYVNARHTACGTVIFHDTSAGNGFTGVNTIRGFGTSAQITITRVPAATGQLQSPAAATPFTFAVGDVITFEGNYRQA